MVEVIGENYPDMSEEVGLKAIATVDNDKSSENGNASESSQVGDHGGSSEKAAHSDKNEDSGSISDEGISDILKFDGETTTNIDGNAAHVEAGEGSGVAGEVVEEEIVELEFEKVKPKLATHSMHCPNCKAEVTKVVLRRKVITYRQPETPVEPQRDPDDLVGCLSCLSLFTCSGTGCFNPFDIFRRKSDRSNVAPPPTAVDGTTTPVVTENENCLSMFLIFKKKQKVKATESEDHPQSVQNDRDFIIPDQPTLPKYVTGTSSIAKGQSSVASPQPPSTFIVEDNEVTSVVDEKRLLGGYHHLPASSKAPVDDDKASDFEINKDKSITRGESYPGTLIPLSNAPVEDETAIDVEADGVSENDAAVGGRRRWLGYEGILAEILKSIVYGGLMEVIASLSVVASAAASDTATLNIIALALASLIGGIIIIWHNLWDLRNDCHKETRNQQAEGEAINKYKELFGRINYFPLHVFFAILSFLVFGMVPPVAYGFSFYKTNDGDFTMLAVAIASLLCVALLAIFKAFINECGVLEYFKTVVYYIMTAVSASGVSYVAGNLVTRLVKELGLFDTSSGGGMALLPHATATSLAYF